MRCKLAFLIALSGLTFSCAKKGNLGHEEYVSSYKASLIKRDKHSFCSLIADNTFKGLIWSGADAEDSSCFYIDIQEHPKRLLKDENIFLQLYPFYVQRGEFKYGGALPLKTVSKSEKGGREILMRSKLIDLHLIEEEMGLDPERFFKNYMLEACGVSEDYEGLQLVLYERRLGQDPEQLRASKALTPPFLIQPDHYRGERGNQLAAFHPFVSFQTQLKSRPDLYYDLAEEMCEGLY